jgi:hypothetical protein
MTMEATERHQVTAFDSVTLGMISWKAPRTVAHTFASYERASILDVFGARVIHFNEISEADRTVAAQHDFAVSGSSDNVGIFGGVDALVAQVTTPYFLLVENDCPVLCDRAGLVSAIAGVLDDMTRHDVPVFLMRSRRQPGEPFWRRSRYENRFRIVWPLGTSPAERREMAHPLVRAYEDRRRSALRGSAIYAEEDPTLRHPRIIQETANGNWLTRSPYLQWSNCCFLARTDFLRDVVLDRVRRHPSRTTLNGTQDIEAALKEGNWWRKLDVPIGQCEPGPFTHERLDR